MKNIEKYEHEISKLVNEDNVLSCAIATVAGIRKEKCYPSDCEECQKKCLEWMYSEYNEPILSDDEKAIIISMLDIISRFGCEIYYVCKLEENNFSSFIWIKYKDELTKNTNAIDSPRFRNDMFKGMEIGKIYSLEELGISCQTQKDS